MKCKFCGAEVSLGKACDYCGSVAEYSYYGITEPTAARQTPGMKPIERRLTADGKYIVQRGDTLWHIARSFYGKGTEYHKIVKANRISNPNLIYPGQELRIPV